MKKQKIRLLAIVFALCFILTGCGATPMYELTETERSYIVHSAANILAKHNIKQTDGINSTVPREEQLNDTSEESTEDADAIDLNEPGISGLLTYAEAVGQTKLEVTYKGMKMDDGYQEGPYYMLNPPDKGKKYAILSYTYRNPYIDPIKVDAFSAGPVFYANFGDDNYIKQESTFLTYSVPTYVGTLKAGEKQDVVLIFQVDEKMPNDAKVHKMQVDVNGKKYYINLN